MRRRLLVFAWVLVAAGLGWWVLNVTALEGDDRSDASGYGQFVLAAVGLLIVVGDMVVKALAPAAQPDLDELTDQLASAMRAQWEQAAAERGLLQPAPLPIRWRRSREPVAGPPSAALTVRDGKALFEPLPGMARITAAKLRGGDRRALYRVYGGVPSGRLVLVGEPGSGKSSAAVMLLLDALNYRDQVLPVERGQIPIPMIATLSDWDPVDTPFREWLLRKLVDIPLLRGRQGLKRASELLRFGKIAVFLDGLDEIPEAMRPVALKALSVEAGIRLVLLTRTAELANAATFQPLMGAVALELLPLRPSEVADYLLSLRTDPAPLAWKNLARVIADAPGSPVSRAFSTPLGVGLLRDIPAAVVADDDLLDVKRFPTSQAVVDHLLDQAVTVAYSPRPGYAPPAYTPDRARRALKFIAGRLGEKNSRDLSWWTISEWAPPFIVLLIMTTPSAFAATSFFFIGSYAVLLGRDEDLVSALIPHSTVVGSVFLVMFVLIALAGACVDYLTMRIERRYSHRMSPKVKPWLFSGRSPRRPAIGRGVRGNLIRRLNLLLALSSMTGLAVGGILLFLGDDFEDFAVGAAGGVALALTIGLSQISVAKNDGVGEGPLQGVRADWRATGAAVLVSMLTGAVSACLIGWKFTIWGAIFGFFIGMAIALSDSIAWRNFAAQMYLSIRYRIPLRLMHFLDDARSRHLLRTVGPIYQFRHATLQDRLAGRATPDSAADNEPPAPTRDS